MEDGQTFQLAGHTYEVLSVTPGRAPTGTLIECRRDDDQTETFNPDYLSSLLPPT